MNLTFLVDRRGFTFEELYPQIRSKNIKNGLFAKKHLNYRVKVSVRIKNEQSMLEI